MLLIHLLVLPHLVFHVLRFYSSSRIGAAAALTVVLVVLLVLDVAIPAYDISPGVLLPLLGAILALLGLEASAVWRGLR